MDKSPEEILKRLEELRHWQGLQQEKLLTKQLSQSQLCSMEQQKLCEMFGLSVTSTVSNLSLSEHRQQTPTKEIVGGQEFQELADDQFDMEASVPSTPQKQFRVETPINNFSLEELESYDKEHQNQSNLDIENKPKKSFLKRGQGLAARFRIHPEALRIENLPKYKFANAHKKSKFFGDSHQHSEVKRLDVAKGKQFAGDSKLTHSNADKQDVVAVQKQQVKFIDDVRSGAFKDNFDQRPTTNKHSPPSVAWANFFQSQQKPEATASKSIESVSSTPTISQKLQKQRQDQRDLQIFELLEQNLNNSSVLQNSEAMKRLVEYLLANPIKSPLQQFGARQELHFDRSSLNNNSDRNGTAKRTVRFAMDSMNHGIEDSESETIESTDIKELDQSKTSTPLAKAPLEMFQPNLFIENNSTLVEQENNSMKLRNEELKQRLTELQNEIQLFQQQNSVLTKSMREHEVEKLLWEEQKNEMIDKMEDERIRQEVYFHDERMKLVDEQKKLDKRIKELRVPNRKDKEEMAKLKQENADFQKELTNKDQKHISAQSRLRAQIRNMEKDLKEFSMEIDNLRKENKKIESENVRLRRQSNNKMLNEINKNIAKLAPKMEQQMETVEPSSKSKLVNKDQSQSSGSRPKNYPNLIKVQEVPKTLASTDDSESDESSSSTERTTYFKKVSQSKNDKISTPSEDVPTLESNPLQNLKREIVNSDGSRDIWYPNGNLKKISADEMVIRMLYFNKDVKETNIHEGTVKYYYAEANTWQTTYLDGLEIWEFPNGRNEHQFKDGRVETHHPDGSICTTNPNDMETAEEWKYLNGTTFVIKRNGDKYLNLPNGQREVTTKNHIRREYPDGTVKIKYPDGSLETRYSNGRIRLRDAAGTLIRDSETH